MMKKLSVLFLLVVLPIIKAYCQNAPEFDYYVTTPDRKSLLTHNPEIEHDFDEQKAFTINVDEKIKYQTVEGFGYTLTGGSAYLIRQKLTESQRKSLLKELFSEKEGIGLQWLRISVGASDLNAFPFTYQEKQKDIFNLNHDKTDLIPLLQEIVKINPKIKLLATPWSPPVWMKDNGSYIGGSLLKSHHGTYAAYLVKYVRAMKTLGLTIHALTPQNEPENPHNNPSLLMTAAEQSDFIANYLGPAFRKAGIKTKIILFDHNCDHPEYPIEILKNKKANPYIEGSAFHLYAGEISALSKVHNAFPDKNIYFTEQWTSSEGQFGGDLQWHIRNVIIGSLRNWSKVAMEWNLANDKEMRPHTEGGCDKCLGAITIDENGHNPNVAYFVIAHASQWIPPGSVRIKSNVTADFPNVVVLRPDGRKAMILMNSKNETQDFIISDKNRSNKLSLEAGAVATVVWK